MRRLIQKHRVDRFDIGSTEALDVWNDIGVVAVAEQLIIKIEILHFSDSGLPMRIFSALPDEGNVPDDLNARNLLDLPIAVLQEPLRPSLDVCVLQKILDDEIAVLLVELSLLLSQASSVDSVAELTWLHKLTLDGLQSIHCKELIN